MKFRLTALTVAALAATTMIVPPAVAAPADQQIAGQCMRR